jgi:outer membrane protein assembly factor BamB
MAGNAVISPDSYISPPTAANGIAYYGTASAKGPSAPFRVYAIAEQTTAFATTGQVLWQSQNYVGPVHVAPTVANGKLFVATYDGKVYAYSVP